MWSGLQESECVHFVHLRSAHSDFHTGYTTQDDIDKVSERVFYRNLYQQATAICWTASYLANIWTFKKYVNQFWPDLYPNSLLWQSLSNSEAHPGSWWQISSKLLLRYLILFLIILFCFSNSLHSKKKSNHTMQVEQNLIWFYVALHWTYYIP